MMVLDVEAGTEGLIPGSELPASGFASRPSSTGRVAALGGLGKRYMGADSTTL